MSIVSFVKYQGSGNDFILIDDRKSSFPCSNSTFIQKMCHRRFGVGADGLILLQQDRPADFKMRIFNSDGLETESCGNGLRCLARFIADLGFGEKKYCISLSNQRVEVWFEGDLIAIDMGKPSSLDLNLETELGVVHFVHTGVPHVVHFVSDVEKMDLSILGPQLRYHPRFQPKGANVTVVSQGTSGGVFLARTYERGVEGETLACGTGAIAIAWVARAVYNMKLPLRISFKGGDLMVGEKEEQVYSLGPAVKVYQGFF